MFGCAMCGLVQLLGMDVVGFAGPSSPVSLNEDVCKTAIDNKYTSVRNVYCLSNVFQTVLF